ncbi:DUF58 domain-containing protein [Aliikangiella sp. IMCC44653]
MKLTRIGVLWLIGWIALALIEVGVRLYLFASEKAPNSFALDFIWLIYAAVLSALFAWEILSLKQRKNFKLQRELPHTLPVNSFTQVNLHLTNLNLCPVKLMLYEHYPDNVRLKNMPVSININSNAEVNINYQIKVVERGELTIDITELWIESLFGLLRKRLTLTHPSRAKVYPNYRSIMNYVLLATEQKTRQIGIRQRQRRGEGMDFHQLREYRIGDSLRQIDWRATSRLKKIISKEYQQERDQNIIFLLDSGRRMRAKDGDLSHFDQALNATLLVASIALKQGDAVGLNVFGGQQIFVPPSKGPSATTKILNAVYSVHPSNNASDFIGAAKSLCASFKKRSLVIVISNVRKEDDEEYSLALKILSKHHLVMLANLRESALDQILDKDISNIEDAVTYAQSSLYLAERANLHKRLLHQGTTSIDCVPSHLAVNLVNEYFDIKQSGRL